jgi:hypothetical protein
MVLLAAVVIEGAQIDESIANTLLVTNLPSQLQGLLVTL